MNKPSNIKQNAQLISGVGASSWFTISAEKNLYRIERFSLEGAESLIPALDALVEHSSELGVKEFFVGMSHRGRLNVLANIFNKTYKEIFSEFEGKL